MSEIENIIIKHIDELYNSAHNPNGWVLGKVVAHHIANYFSSSLTKDNADTLYGIPFILDNENPERIELIQ